MKKLCFSILFFLQGFLMFSEQIDYGYILFQPNQSEFYVEPERVSRQLDELAEELKQLVLNDGQIHVSGYTAMVENDIDDITLSEARARKIIGELQGRGIPPSLFAQPLAKGSTFVWGANTSESERGPNRRVTLFVDKMDPPQVIVEEPPSDEPVSSFPWWMLIVLLIIIVIAGVIWLIAKRSSPSVEITMPIKPSPQTDDDEYGLPPDAIKMLKRKGLTKDEIKEVKQTKGGKGGSVYIPPEDDKEWDQYIQTQIDYLEGGYKKGLEESSNFGPGYKALARLVENDPERRQTRLENFQLMKNREKGVKFEYSSYITNMEDYGYYTTNVYSTLGVDIYPSDRNDCFRIANLSTAIEQNELSPEEGKRAKALAQKIYNKPWSYSADELREFESIKKKAPDYTADGMTWHEHENGQTLTLVAAGKLHSGGDEGTPGGLTHYGGHSLLVEAEKIIKNRK
jgi:hypothetical protein